MSDMVTLLQKTPLFKGITRSSVEPFAQAGRLRNYAAGEIIFAEMTNGTEIFVLVDGEVTIELALANADHPVEIVKLGPGELLGEIAFVDDGPRSATATAVTATTALAWPASVWRELADKDPATGYRLAMAIARVLSQRLRRWNVRILDSVSWGIE